MTKIVPTIGRVMWFWRSGVEGVCFDSKQPMAAIVAFVNNEHSVNLTVFDHAGHAQPVAHVPVMQEGEVPPAGDCYATWMPYQIGQARMQMPAQVGMGHNIATPGA